jgi:hypothetical protein
MKIIVIVDGQSQLMRARLLRCRYSAANKSRVHLPRNSEDGRHLLLCKARCRAVAEPNHLKSVPLRRGRKYSRGPRATRSRTVPILHTFKNELGQGKKIVASLMLEEFRIITSSHGARGFDDQPFGQRCYSIL